MPARILSTLVALSLLTFTACSNEPDAPDAGQPLPDASSIPDAGLLPDAGEIPDAGEEPDAGLQGPELAQLNAFMAEHLCSALFRCCDDASLGTWFAPYANHVALTDTYASQLPPADEADCRRLVAEMNGLVIFADWIAQAEAGSVQYNRDAAQACADELDAAACGDEVGRALFDGTCFGPAAPGGGDEQRRVFTRTAIEGEACASLHDGMGGLFYGGCDPTKAFCCYPTPDKPTGHCGYPNAEGLGTCVATAAAGEACEAGVPPLKLCQTGFACDSATGTCVEQLTGPLSVGEACVDDAFNQLGECVDSWCDSFGPKVCAPLKANGQACFGPEECITGYCDAGACADNAFCTGR